jgi:hypothetical protein
VTEARLADPKQYDDRSTNPYSIRYAVYNFALDWEDLYSAVIDARNANVEVQVMVDDGQLGPNRDYNKGLQALKDAGFLYEASQKNLTVAEQEAAELIGVDCEGIMHLKTRLFAWLDEDGQERKEFMTGSFNPELGADTGVPMPNNDTLVSFEIGGEAGDEYLELFERCVRAAHARASEARARDMRARAKRAKEARERAHVRPSEARDFGGEGHMCDRAKRGGGHMCDRRSGG